MRLYYINQAEGRRHHVRSALGVDAEAWNDFFRNIHEWRLELRQRHGIPCERQLRASELLNGSVELGNRSCTDCWTRTSGKGEEIFADGLRRIEEAALAMGGIEVINVCLYKPDCQGLQAGRPQPAAQPHQCIRSHGKPPRFSYLRARRGRIGFQYLQAVEDVQPRAQ